LVKYKNTREYLYLLSIRNIYVRDEETMRENMRTPLLLYDVIRRKCGQTLVGLGLGQK